MAYLEELNTVMFTVHHYSPIPFLHVYTCMCIYPDCDKNETELILSLWLVQCGILTPMSTRCLKMVLVKCRQSVANELFIRVTLTLDRRPQL